MNDFTGTYNRFEAKCKICCRPIQLHIDQDYDQLRDPQGLLPLATCDSCFDLRMFGVRLHRSILRMVVRVNLETKAKNLDADQLAKRLEVCRLLSNKLLDWIPRMRQRCANLDRIFQARTEKNTLLYGHVGDWAKMIEHCYNAYHGMMEEVQNTA